MENQESQNQPTLDEAKKNQLKSLMEKIQILNQKNKKLEDYVYDLDLAQAQDLVKEDMTFTIN